MKDIFTRALEHAQRRKHAEQYNLPCRACGSEQIRLVEWIEEIKFKCRDCGHKWTVRNES